MSGLDRPIAEIYYCIFYWMYYLCHAYFPGEDFFMGRQPILQELVLGDDAWLHFKEGETASTEHPLPLAGHVQQPLPDFYDDFYMTCFNLIFTLLPPFAVGFFEQNLPQQTLLKYPQLHNTEKSNIQFPNLAFYICTAIYQSVAIYYVVRLGCRDWSLETNGTVAYFAVVYTVTIQLIFWMRSFNYITIFIGFTLTFVVLYAIAAIYGLGITPEIAASTRQVLGTVKGWFILFNAVGWALLPPFIIEYFRDQYFPTLERLLRERVKKDLKDPIDFTLAMSILEKEEQKFKSKPDALIV